MGLSLQHVDSGRQSWRASSFAENGQGRYQQEVIAGQHRLLADEPVSVGGADAGPAPFDFVMAGLGACTSMTLRMYAERKGLPLTAISVNLSHDKVKVDGVHRDRIVRRITLEGDLTPSSARGCWKLPTNARFTAR